MQAQSILFRKMNGLGNDFVVLDARTRPLVLGDDVVRAIADRKEGIGCDQLIALEPSTRADVFMRIWNADGGEVGACGNAARCVASLVAAELGEPRVSIETAASPSTWGRRVLPGTRSRCRRRSMIRGTSSLRSTIRSLIHHQRSMSATRIA